MRGLIHANTGRPSRHRLSEMLRQKALRLSGEVYREFNDTHFTEKLGEEEGIVLSRETVRGIRQEAGIEPTQEESQGQEASEASGADAPGRTNGPVHHEIADYFLGGHLFHQILSKEVNTLSH